MTHIIEPERFAERMQEHWTKNLGNVESPALKETWAWIGHHLNLHLQDHDSPSDRNQWYCLSAPTGTGKTQGVVVYCSMLAESGDHPGALIITRRIADAVDIADQINQWGGRQTAVAYHEGNDFFKKPTIGLDELDQWPVVVITHSAFLGAFGADPSKSKLRFFMSWKTAGEDGAVDPWGERKLRIVDESLDIVKSLDLCYDSLKETWGAIPAYVMKRFPLEMALIKCALADLEEYTFKADKEKVPRLSVQTGAEGLPDFSELAETAFPDRSDEAHKKHAGRLKSLAGIIKGPWNYLHSDRKKDSLNAARLLMDGGRGCLVLDATAGVDVVYRVHKESQVKLPPPGARRYDNVTLHWSTGHRTGKRSTALNAKADTPRLLDNLEDKLKGRKALFVSHKDTEHVIAGYSGRVPYELKTEHWGNLDGTNEFRDFDAVVLTSLFRLPQAWAINTFMALQGVQGAEWLLDEGDHQWQEFPDIRRALETGKMAASIIQAVNRIRCRKTIDREGNCPPADIFIKFNTNAQAVTILAFIVKAMPGIKLELWDFDPAKPPKKERKSDAAETLLAFLENMNPGQKLEKKTVVGKTHIPSRTMDRLLERLRNPEDSLSKLVAGLSVAVETIRDRSSFRVHFAKSRT